MIARATATGRLPSPVWLYAFVLVQFLCLAALVVEALGGFRFVLRLIPFAVSIGYLAILPAGGPRNPVQPWAVAVLTIIGLGLFHPQTNTLLAGMAQWGLSLAVWAPIFWTSRIAITADVFRRLLLLLWLLNSLSAAVGVLQVYYPGRFAPDPVFVKKMGGENADGLLIRLDDGTELFRPMGLSDSPGGAALAANSAIVMGVGVVLTNRGLFFPLAVAATAVASVFCLYVCQVRSLLILTVISVFGCAGLTALRGEVRRAALLIGAVGVVGILGFAWAIAVSGNAVLARFGTLFEDSASEVYYANRGRFVEDTFTNFIPDYPLGAGLGRWGMMYAYFGEPNDPNSPPLWAEVTLTGWVFDGGVPLLLCGYAAMVVGLWAVARLAWRTRSRRVADFAAVVAGVSVAAFATTISAHVFVAQSGMMYLLLTAAVLAIPRHRPHAR